MRTNRLKRECALKKVTQNEKGNIPNTGSESQMSALAAGLALLGLGTGLAATTRKKED